jgi:hypothetical protein
MQGIGPTIGLIFHAFYMAEGGRCRLPIHALKQAKI